MCLDKTCAAKASAGSAGAAPKPADFKSTLNLPRTAFGMRAGFARLEPELRASWGADNGYGALRSARAGAPAFTLHDGPPYANGHLHMGHALNKVLKDMVTRSRRMMGYDARLRPGWDCHGLPVEWKVEEDYRAQGRGKDDVPVLEFRKACRAYAAGWLDVQREEFRALGVAADWSDPYVTMDFASEAAVAREFMSLVKSGLVYQGISPVMWSPVEQTTLADAEVEYHDRKSPAVWVGYRATGGRPDLEGALLVAWTTTPWTLPSSAAVAVSPKLSYGLYRVERQTEGSWARPGTLLVLSCDRARDAAQALRAELYLLRNLENEELASLSLTHPLSSLGKEWQEPLPCLLADHVTGDAGTGLVHTAPAHGEDDFRLGQARGLPLKMNLTDDGRLRADMEVFGGLAVVEPDGRDGPANEAVVAALQSAGTLLARRTVTHSYPHSWRSKAPVLFRVSPQWFASVDRSFTPSSATAADGNGKTQASVRQGALAALDAVDWQPKSSRNRLEAMLQGRPDWLLSRQRAWGVPLTLFTRRGLASDHPDFLLKDERVNARVLEAFEKEGADAWYQAGAKRRFLAPDHDPDQFEMCMDVLDVWFDSGASHAYALAEGEEQADLYLEGTDQHRGWFQASLLHGVATRGRSPYRAVLTHGFALDSKGRKMSKSLGNVVLPQDVQNDYGADVLRLWVAMADYTQDFRAGKDAFDGARDAYRKMRNTLRFMLGALEDKTAQPERPTELPLLERWLLDRAAQVSGLVTKAYLENDFGRAMHEVLGFCNNELSAVFFDVRKDVLYCDPANSGRRRAALYALSECLSFCLSWMAPVLVFTAEDAWRLRYGRGGVHLSLLHARPEHRDPEAAALVSRHLRARSSVLAALEEARRERAVTKSAFANIVLPASLCSHHLDLALMAELCLVAEVTVDRDCLSVRVERSAYAECDRCRRAVPDVALRALSECEAALCARCASSCQEPSD